MLYPLCRTHVCNTHTSAYIQLEHIYVTHTQMLRCHVYHHGAHILCACSNLRIHATQDSDVSVIYTIREPGHVELAQASRLTLHMLMYTPLNA